MEMKNNLTCVKCFPPYSSENYLEATGIEAKMESQQRSSTFCPC